MDFLKDTTACDSMKGVIGFLKSKSSRLIMYIICLIAFVSPSAQFDIFQKESLVLERRAWATHVYLLLNLNIEI